MFTRIRIASARARFVVKQIPQVFECAQSAVSANTHCPVSSTTMFVTKIRQQCMFSECDDCSFEDFFQCPLERKSNETISYYELKTILNSNGKKLQHQPVHVDSPASAFFTRFFEYAEIIKRHIWIKNYQREELLKLGRLLKAAHSLGIYIDFSQSFAFKIGIKSEFYGPLELSVLPVVVIFDPADANIEVPPEKKAQWNRLATVYYFLSPYSGHDYFYVRR